MKYFRLAIIISLAISVIKGGFIYDMRALAFTPTNYTKISEDNLIQAASDYKAARTKVQEIKKKLKKEPTPQPNNPELLGAKKDQLSTMIGVMTQYLTILKAKLLKIRDDEIVANQIQGEINKIEKHQNKIRNIKDDDGLAKEVKLLKNDWLVAKNVGAKMSCQSLNNQLEDISGQMETNLSNQLVAINQLKQFNKDTTKAEALTQDLKKVLNTAKEKEGLVKTKILGISNKSNRQDILTSVIVIMRKAQEVLVMMADNIIKVNTEISRLSQK